MTRTTSVLLVAACIAVASAASLAKVSVGPHVPRWGASAISVTVDDAGDNHVVGYFDEPTKRSLMHMDWPESNELFGNTASTLCVDDTLYFFNSTECFRIDMNGESCFSNPLDFRGASAEGECGNNGQTLWVHPRGARICVAQNNVVKKLAINDENSLEIDTFRWFQHSVSTQAGFWSPPAHCTNAHQTRLMSSLIARQQARPNTLSGLARDFTRIAQLLH